MTPPCAAADVGALQVRSTWMWACLTNPPDRWVAGACRWLLELHAAAWAGKVWAAGLKWAADPGPSPWVRGGVDSPSDVPAQSSLPCVRVCVCVRARARVREVAV